MSELTPHNIHILEGVARGWTDARIAAELGISINTVKTLLKRIFDQLGATNRAHAVALAYEDGILHIGSPT